MKLEKALLGSYDLAWVPVTLARSGLRRSQVVGAPRSRPCYVLGNGPSLCDSLPENAALPNGDFVCVNSFACSPLYPRVRPKYYVVADPDFYRTKAIDASRTDAVAQSLRSLEDETSGALRWILERTDWDMELFVPYLDRDRVIESRLRRNSRVRVRYYNLIYFRHLPQRLSHFLADMGLAIIGGQTVLTAAIYIAIKLGYREVRVLGADHSMHRDLFVGTDNVVYSSPQHFYSSEGTAPLPFVVDADRGTVFRMKDWLAAFSRMFDDHEALRQYATRHGSRIINLTPNSFIDAYDRS
jgi:hypothetical protein